MRQLPQVEPTAEQLRIISANQLGAEIIRGAAGSGKTTTALLRLRSRAGAFAARKRRMGVEEPVRTLVLTFNRTLAGYIRALAEAQLADLGHIVEIFTFAKWAKQALGDPDVHPDECKRYMSRLTRSFDALDASYLQREVDYLLGRFTTDRLEDYISTERTGRGNLPRVDLNLRRRILDEVIYPYQHKIASEGWVDWNTLAVRMVTDLPSLEYDIAIVDESQDFSANQIRAVQHHLAPEYAATFVIDTAQRIYARGFAWTEAGVQILPGRSHSLTVNHRNTRQIAAFAAGVLDGVQVDGDGVLPSLDAAPSDGVLPQVISGRYAHQLDWALDYIEEHVDLDRESVAFLKPEGGQWFQTLKSALRDRGFPFAKITRNGDWPDGEENIAISTFHSAKGLEFDHVIIIGFNQKNTAFGDEERDDQLLVLRRLLAVAVARARRHVVIGYKPGEESRLTDFFAPGTFEEITL